MDRYPTNTRSSVVLNAKDVLRININIEVGAVTETIEVRENSVVVELGTPESSSTIEGEQIRELALGTVAIRHGGVRYRDCYSKRTPVRWNDFGGTIGGPIFFGRFNKQKNRTFFFFSEEMRRIVNYTTLNPTLPTAGMIQGNFIQPVCITQIVNGTITCAANTTPVKSISQSQWNPNAVAYISDIWSKMPLLSGDTTAATTSGF